ncbi:MAG: glycosyltransferase family 4 protein [Bacteroidales bacterium]|jgi:glycosyltransferase involved in cell wall biosynthesis|nr:glycosyltransferase family 4 protein [Bacteroidales bacterium]
MIIGIEGQRLFRGNKHGMDFVALELIKNLQQIDIHNEYYIFIKPGPDKCLQSSGNFHVVELPGPSYPLWEQIILPRAARKYRCDMLHCTSNTGPVFCPVPLILTLHDIFYLENVSLFTKGFSAYQKFGNMYRRYIVPAVVKHSRKIITVSNSEKNRIASFFKIFDSRLTFIYNGVSTNFKPVEDHLIQEKVRNIYHLPEHFILLIGNTDPKKNTKGVVKAYADYFHQCNSPLPIVIVDYPESGLNKLLEENGLSEIASHIVRLDYIRNTDLPAVYSMSSLFLYPSFWESFGIPILEAMSCNTPVVTSNVFAMPEIAGDAALLVDPGKTEDLTTAMCKLTTDICLRDQLIERGKIQVKKFSWQKMAENYLHLYQTLYDRKTL